MLGFNRYQAFCGKLCKNIYTQYNIPSQHWNTSCCICIFNSGILSPLLQRFRESLSLKVFVRTTRVPWKFRTRSHNQTSEWTCAQIHVNSKNSWNHRHNYIYIHTYIYIYIHTHIGTKVVRQKKTTTVAKTHETHSWTHHVFPIQTSSKLCGPERESHSRMPQTRWRHQVS